MVSSRLFLTLILAVGVLGSQKDAGMCGTVASPEMRRAAREAFQSRDTAMRRQNVNSTTVPVHFHVITDDDSGSADSGYIPGSKVQEQIAVINTHFAGLGLTFNLASITRPVNSTWFHNVAPAAYALDREMKHALRKGGITDLNIFTVNFTAVPSISGYSSFITDLPGRLDLDGIVIKFNSLPGGSHYRYNQGKLCTHETGHWVGLWHPFQGGCDDLDNVADTPAEDYGATGCPTGRDSCPSSPGLDPIHNFMDYSDDYCRTEFTPGQFAYARQQLATYRGLNL